MRDDAQPGGLGVLDVIKRAMPLPLLRGADVIDLWELAVELSVRTDELQGGRGWTRMGEKEAHRWVILALLGLGDFAASPPSRLVIYKRDAMGTYYAMDPQDREAVLRARLAVYADDMEPRSTAYLWEFAFLRSDAMAAFELESSEAVRPHGCSQSSVVCGKRAGSALSPKEPTKTVTYQPPVQLAWPRVGSGSAVTDAERNELFRMRHKERMTGARIAVACGLSRQRIDQLIGMKSASRTGDWPKGWSPSAELLKECGLPVPGVKAVGIAAAR